MFPLTFCSLCAQKFWCMRTFLEMTNICITTHVQQYVCAQQIYVCAQSLKAVCTCTRAQLRGTLVAPELARFLVNILLFFQPQLYELCVKSNGTGSINVLFYLISKFYNMSSSK